MAVVVNIRTFFAALAAAAQQFVTPSWVTGPTINTLLVNSLITVNPGTLTGIPTPVVTYALTINGVSKPWPYTLQVADAGLPYVIAPTATVLGNSVPGPSIAGTVPTYVPVFPAVALGQNVEQDATFNTLRVYNDRARVVAFYQTPYTGPTITNANLDPTTGLPLTGFTSKILEGVAISDTLATGTWCIRYTAVANAGITLSVAGTITSNTFSAGAGEVRISFTASSGNLVAVFANPVTSLQIYDPTTFSIWSTGGTPPTFNTQVINTTPPYAYLRLMDNALVNSDYVNAARNSWTYDSIPWTARRTPANFFLNNTDGQSTGMPLEWQIELCNVSSKPGWFCVPCLADDNYVTQYGTLIATTLNAGLTADFELANEHWNTSFPAFWTWKKEGYAGQVDVLGFQPISATTLWGKTVLGGAFISTFASDGTTATVVFGGVGHGQTVGASALVPKIIGGGVGYTTFGATGAMTVVDAVTITYPTNQPTTGGAVAAATVLPSAGVGFLALNGASTLFLGNKISSMFSLPYFWHYRRLFQVAALLKAAFVAAGRSASDCRVLLAIQAGSGGEAKWTFGAQNIPQFIAAVFSGAKMSDRLTAVACGGYIELGQSVANPDFGLTGNFTTPQTMSDVVNQLKQLADVQYGCYSYGTFAAWVKDQGLECWGYEIGLDTFGVGGQSTTTQNACTAANGDVSIIPVLVEWLQGYVAMGFKRIGWYQCGTGSYATTGCFLLGNTTAEVTSSTPTAQQSPKFQALIASSTPWAAPPARHLVPCTLSGYDCTGNEPVTVVGTSWPSLSNANLNGGTYTGNSNNGETYYVWLDSQIAQTSLVQISGDYTTATATTITVQPVGRPTGEGSTFALAGVHTASPLGQCTVTLQPGANYVLITASNNSANVFPHSITFN